MKKTVLGRDLQTGKEITVSDKERRSGVYLLQRRAERLSYVIE